ncbi:hypothetical protein [uncultured Acetobacteroides sp.]|uniref:hypothetical protein n=1 Tax=uncultured Acetobacteroides sp. TaxID=1760811 RepID=UPI0029F47E6A|nr:hypothetical protein [uncultured Acetobacteroides sp.]
MSSKELEKEVKRLVHSNRYLKGYVCAVDVLMQLNFLSESDYECWQLGKVDYLEGVCSVNLEKLTLVNKLIRRYAAELNLESSWTEYNQTGKRLSRRLRFSKSGNKAIEEQYATHYVDKKRMEELKENRSSI